MKRHLLYYAVLVLVLASGALARGALVESFDSDPGWAYVGTSYWGGLGGGPQFSGGVMDVRTANLKGFLVVTPFVLEGDFDIEVTGTTYTSGSNQQTHSRHYVGIAHTGSTSDPNLQLRFGNPGQELISRPDDTHYNIDLGNQVGLNTVFRVRFVRADDVITTYSWNFSSEIWQTLDSYALAAPTADLYFEFVELDGSSMGAGHTEYDEFVYVPEPATAVLVAAWAVMGLACRKRRAFVTRM